MKSEQALGVFDSGIGGLSVARAIKKICPKEKIIYFGDTAHLPYGDKAQAQVESYSLGISRYLSDKHFVKGVVMACHTASAIAYDYVRAHCAPLPIWNTVYPTVDFICAQFNSQHSVGIIGTKNTIGAKIYDRLISPLAHAPRLCTLPTPLLASMIENKYATHHTDHAMIADYLSHPALQNIDALVLACTHYPLIKEEIAQYYAREKRNVRIIDPAELIAVRVAQDLQASGLSRATPATDRDQFFVSAHTPSFTQCASELMSADVQENNIWTV